MSSKNLLKTLDRKTLTDEVVKILERSILSGIFKPNERLVEREIAERLGVSRVPIREALIRLKTLGLVKELRRDLINLQKVLNTGMIDISQDLKTGESVLVALKGIRRKQLGFCWPEKMWRGRGSKEEVLQQSKRLLEEMILAD